MKILIQLFALVILGLFVSCESNPVASEADIMDIVVLSKTPGYQWYDIEVENYQPDSNIVNQIKDKFDPALDSFVLYVKPSCSCPGTQQQFPAIMKVFNSAGIPSTNYKIYSMSSEMTKHPFESIFKVNELPSFFLMRSSNAIYSISDTFYLRQTTGNSKSLENFVLEALNK